MTQGVATAEPVATDIGAWSETSTAERPAADRFDQIYLQHMPRVYRYLNARLGSVEDAADVTQLVFMRAWSALPSYTSGKAPFAAWLFRIARNAATDHRRATRPLVALDDADPFERNEASDPLAAALASERAARLRTLIGELSQEKQELLALRFAAGLSSREIAAATGKSEAAVKKQLTRTLGALKEHYRDES